jgi:hypothetical protein
MDENGNIKELWILAEDTGLWLKPRTFEVFPVTFAAKRNYDMLWKSQIKELG